jgi:hypothetical protein
MNLLAEVADLLDQAVRAAVDQPTADRLAYAQARLAEPLRVALVGRAKTGKSTLLNALVGDLVAPTDAAECTLIPTEYHDGLTYRAWKVDTGGAIGPARFVRDDDGAHIDLAGAAVEDLTRLLVEFPSASLRDLTLVDTPGLGSVNRAVSQRTLDFTSAAEGAPADAVVYLLRNWHRVDSEFLAAFHDRAALDVPPVSSLAVLARADEVGGGADDALDAARRLAQSLCEDPTLRGLVVNVVPVAGLLAQSAVTLTEAAFRDLAAIAACPPDARAAALLSADRFRAPERLAAVPPERRERLVRLLGLYGVRAALAAIADGRAPSAQALSGELVQASGLDAVRTVIFRQFALRAPVVKASHALDLIETYVAEGRVRPGPAFLDDLERVQINAHAITELRALNEVLCSPTLAIAPHLRAALPRVLGSEGLEAADRLGRPPETPAADLTLALRDEHRRWQLVAGSATSLPDEQRLARVAVQSLAGVLAVRPPVPVATGPAPGSPLPPPPSPSSSSPRSSG